jgi:hypothetical protein
MATSNSTSIYTNLTDATSIWQRYPAWMVSDIDIWRAATLLIKQYGPDAEIVAAQRADELAERADDEGRRVASHQVRDSRF